MQKLGAMGMLSEGKGFLTCGENEAGRPYGVASTEPGMPGPGVYVLEI